MKVRTVFLALSVVLISSCAVSRPLPKWSEGNLDIHFINNGRGEGYFCIFPDGTTMMVDAGDTRGAGGAYEAMPPRRPDSLTSGAKAYVDYIRHFLPERSGGKLDYILLSHFHSDHFGDPKLAGSREGGYRHFCLAEVYDSLGAAVLLDRGWPSYDNVVKNTSGTLPEYAKFARRAESLGTRVEQFALGSRDQITMRRGGGYDFTVTNIGANCSFVTAAGDTVSTAFTSENAGSCCFHMKYGKFDFIACGDLSGAPQNLWAEKWYPSVGKPAVEVFKAHHHLHHNAWGSGMVRAGFKAQTIFGFCFGKTDEKHVTVPVLEKAADAGDVFLTNAYGGSVGEHPETYARMKGYNGHFVVRVKPGGNGYMVYKLRDTDKSFLVLEKYGPYKSEQ